MRDVWKRARDKMEEEKQQPLDAESSTEAAVVDNCYSLCFK